MSALETPPPTKDNVKCHHFVNDAGEQIYPGWGMDLETLMIQQDDCPHHHLVDVDPTRWHGVILARRETNMILAMQKLMTKPNWFLKVFDDGLCDKWMAEVMSQVEDFSELMWKYCVAELRDKAKILEETGLVAPIDVDTQVVYSDIAISQDLRRDLNEAVAILENVPDRDKDWHPGTRDRVLDLVHPSLFPLVYGRSRIMKEGLVGLEDCTSYCGQGETIPKPDLPDVGGWSDQFQWLPCDIKFEGEEDVRITSYINNLHPREHRGIYSLVEKVIAKAIPLWDQVLSHTGGGPYEKNGIKRHRDFVRPFKARVDVDDYEWEWPYGEERPIAWTLDRQPETHEEKAELKNLVELAARHLEDTGERLGEEEEEDQADSWELDEAWKRNMRVLCLPEPKPYQSREIPEEAPLNLRKEYANSGLQIIVKLANTYLTPDDPQWDGGSWHVEGLLNEQIVATAIYYYSNTNITSSHLKFRHNGSDESWSDMSYDQHDYAHLETISGFQNGVDLLIQNLGSVPCEQGRLLAFANVLQHNVGSFKLEDETKPGERKILALFLVNPHIRILSTAKVPPQQKDWWAKEIRKQREDIEKLRTLPNELMQKVFDNVQDFPISLNEAKEIRKALMEERGPIGQQMVECEATFAFCEH
ncbi:hypothetical protein E4T39_01866 [Aureobasidium subglaciale]|nr:hypothetical protein E4T39_01866 [Aureobasidium subglaciale]